MSVFKNKVKITLTSAEFLSFYNGILFMEDFSIIPKTCEKIFGFYPIKLKTIHNCFKQFKKEINNQRPDLVEAVNRLGPFVKEDSNEVMDQIKEYCSKFEKIIGSNRIKIKPIQYEDNQIEM